MADSDFDVHALAAEHGVGAEFDALAARVGTEDAGVLAYVAFLAPVFQTVGKAGARHKARPPVGELPMLWKEVSVEGGVRINWAAAILLAILFLLTLTPGVLMIIFHYLDWNMQRGDPWFAREMNVWVRLAGPFVGHLRGRQLA